MTVAAAIRQFAADNKLTSSGEVLHAMRQPTVTFPLVTTGRPSAADEKELADVVSPLVISKAQLAVLPPESREDAVARRFAARLKAATTDAERAPLLNAWVQAQILKDAIRARGGDPFGPDAGLTTKATATRTVGPSWWETTFPGQPLPSRKRVEAILSNQPDPEES